MSGKISAQVSIAALLVGVVALLPSPASTQTEVPQPAKLVSSPAGNIFETSAGMALYVYDGDQIDQGQAGQSSCDGSCAQMWPPFKAPTGAKPIGDWGIISRKDGLKQWAYKGRPVYTFSKDTMPGQTSGNGYDGNTWHLAKP